MIAKYSETERKKFLNHLEDDINTLILFQREHGCIDLDDHAFIEMDNTIRLQEQKILCLLRNNLEQFASIAGTLQEFEHIESLMKQVRTAKHDLMYAGQMEQEYLQEQISYGMSDIHKLIEEKVNA